MTKHQKLYTLFTHYLSSTQQICLHISAFNLKFLHIINVETILSSGGWIMCTIFDVLSHFLLFCCKISLFYDLRCFVAKSVLSRFTRFGVEKNLVKNFACGEKRTNIRYVSAFKFVFWDNLHIRYPFFCPDYIYSGRIMPKKSSHATRIALIQTASTWSFLPVAINWEGAGYHCTRKSKLILTNI